MNFFRLVLAAVALGGMPMTAMAADSLPLKRGYYVDTTVPCEEASNATLSLYNGVAFGQAHAECQKPVTVKLPDGTYRIREPCRDPQGGGGKWETTTRVYKIISDTEFSMTGKYGEFRSRYCPQSDLPEPWKTADRAKSAK